MNDRMWVSNFGGVPLFLEEVGFEVVSVSTAGAGSL